MRGCERARLRISNAVFVMGVAGLVLGAAHAPSAAVPVALPLRAAVPAAMNAWPAFAMSATAHASSAPALILVADGGRFSVDDISGPAGKPIPVRISLPPENDDLFRVVMFQGIPEEVSFSGGFALGEAWAVSPEDLDGLALVAPEDFTGEFPLDVIYVHGKGEARERQRISVRIGDAPAKAAPAVSAEVEKAMFTKSRRLLETGDVAGARLVFEFLARKGSARGAFALAQTYDTEFLESLSVRGGVRPDMAKAMKWYREAARLGSEPASTRLGALRAGQ